MRGGIGKNAISFVTFRLTFLFAQFCLRSCRLAHNCSGNGRVAFIRFRSVAFVRVATLAISRDYSLCSSALFPDLMRPHCCGRHGPRQHRMMCRRWLRRSIRCIYLRYIPQNIAIVVASHTVHSFSAPDTVTTSTFVEGTNRTLFPFHEKNATKENHHMKGLFGRTVSSTISYASALLCPARRVKIAGVNHVATGFRVLEPISYESRQCSGQRKRQNLVHQS